MFVMKGFALSLMVVSSFDKAAAAESAAGVCMSTSQQTSPLNGTFAISTLGSTLPKALAGDDSQPIRNVKLYDIDDGLLEAMNRQGGDKYTVQLGIPNSKLNNEGVEKCRQAVQKYKNLKFEILVGNEPYHNSVNGSLINNVLRKVLEVIPQAKVSVPFAMDILTNTYPPKDGIFSPDFKRKYNETLETLFGTPQRSFFSINLYPCFTPNLALDTLLKKDILENMIGATIAAIQQYTNTTRPLELTLGETGWPSAGSGVNPGTANNAKEYFKNAYKYLSNTETGLRSWYLFEAFDEEKKTGSAQEPHFGILQSNGEPKW